MTKSSAAVSEYSGNLRSAPRTQTPSLFNRLTRCEPINPPAPQTRAVGWAISGGPDAGVADARAAAETGGVENAPRIDQRDALAAEHVGVQSGEFRPRGHQHDQV